jgi:hypothetical protein
MPAFLTILDNTEGFKISGEKAVLKTGQVIVARGVFEDEGDAGAALAVVIRPHRDARGYFVRFVEAGGDDWAWHLFDRKDAKEITLMQIMSKWGASGVKKNGPEEIEWVTAWWILAEPDEVPDLDELPWLKSRVKAEKSIKFIREWMCTEKEPQKVTIPFKVNKPLPSGKGFKEITITNGIRPA